MDRTIVLGAVKAKLGISTTARDETLLSDIDGVIEEFKELALDGANSYHFNFIVDYVAWIYKSIASNDEMPKHLKKRLNKLFIRNAGGGSV